MRRLSLVFLLLSACASPPVIDWSDAEAPPTPDLLPGVLLVPPVQSENPGPALEARAEALRSGLGL